MIFPKSKATEPKYHWFVEGTVMLNDSMYRYTCVTWSHKLGNGEWHNDVYRCVFEFVDKDVGKR